jgi:DNA-binding response OmpR family regulator
VQQPELGTKPRVLIIDDDIISSKLLAARLREHNLDLHSVQTADAAFTWLASQQVDIILLDIVMPGMSGLEVLRKLREVYAGIELPVIMCTARESDQDLVEALNAGANDYLTKPINLPVALARIRTQLTLQALSRDLSIKRQLEAVNAMMVTYNHEINNPLAIAVGHLSILKRQDLSAKARLHLEKTDAAVARITDIMHKIRDLTTSGKIEFTSYVTDSKMIKLK